MEEDADGDRVIEVVSTGALYRGGDWERKYWSCSRGKDRYPYPVGYHTVRHFYGISYTMEIQQGPRGPLFIVTSTEGDSATGQTPDIAWKNFQKKNGAKVRNLQRRRSFPQNIDGVELFGFKNASVQRLLRELIVCSTEAVVLNLPCPVTTDVASLSTNKDAADVSDAECLPVCLDKKGGTAKRTVKPSQVDGAAKRVHYQDIRTCSDSSQGSANGGGPASRAGLQDVTDSMVPLLDEIHDNSKYTSVDGYMGEAHISSSQQDGLSSGSFYVSSEKSGENEAARSMMSILLPKAIPFLERRKKKKKSKRKRKEKNIVLVRTDSAHNPSDDDHQGVIVPTAIGEGMDINSSEIHVHGESHCEMVKHGCTNADCTNDDMMNIIVADSFEDDDQIWGDKPKSVGFHNYESDDACSREPNENSKVVYDKIEVHAEPSECPVGVHDITETPDVVYDHEKGKYILSDALLACLEEEFGGEDTSYPANYDNYDNNIEKIKVEQQFKDPTNSIKDCSSIPMDVSYHKNIDNGSSKVCAQASAEQNDTGNWGKHVANSTWIAPSAGGAKSSLSAMRGEQHHPQVPDIDQKENSFHVNYKCRKNDDLLARSVINCNSKDAEFVDKYVDYESSGKGENSNQGSKRVNTTTEWPVGDRTKGGSRNPLGQVQESLDLCRNGNENTVMSVGCETNICEHKPCRDEHPLDHARSSTNTNGLVSKRESDHHLELVGCYQHPFPVLSITLNTKNDSSLHICVLCGLLESCQRFLYVYTTTSKDQQGTPPSFVGYSSLHLPTLEQSYTGNFLFGKSGLQFTPDGQFLVLLSSIRIPFCRMQSMECLCPVCKLDQCDDNSLKIVSLNFGYVSLMSKLMPCGMVSCIFICEPNYIIAAEGSRNLHIWKMVSGWSGISKEYVIPSLQNVGPSIIELRIMSKGSSLIIGHDGEGGFCLWDIHRRTLLSTFAAPGNFVFSILPVGVCGLQEDIVDVPVDDIEKRLRGITVSDTPRKNQRESFQTLPSDDIAVWVLVSSASIAEYQHDLRAKEHNARWRLALLTKKRIFLGNILDPRATAVDASGNYGYAGTYGGLLYTWELSSGRKLGGTQCTDDCGRLSCIAVDPESGAVAAGDGGCQLLLYTQKSQR